MVNMSASDDKTPDENRLSDATWYILDETGDTTLPVNTSKTLEEVKIDLSSTAGSCADLSSTLEDTKEVLTTVENNRDLSCTSGEAKQVLSSTPDNKEMFRLRTTTKRKLKKRKRGKSAQGTPTPSPGPGRTPNKKKKRKKSVITIDSDSEPDASVIEIVDEPSVIVLSDDEVGVCSGSLTKPKAAKQNELKKPNNQIVVEDLTGAYLPKKGEATSSKQDASTEKVKKNVELYQPMANQSEKKTGLRPIVIDGCNVAFGHGRDRFSSLGIKICADYFKKLGHEVRVFLPQFRKHHNATTDPQLLDAMEKDGTLCYTPSRRTDGKMIVSYDDRFIVQYADANGGLIVSRDNYRDLLNENPEWKDTIDKRLLMYTWVGDTIMFPKDPLGRHGPNLEEFLRF
uniref:Putative ribonuclease ZC3H12C n=4 Tax=Lygus hesperus TaxID=30085 RepID=A0A0A9YU68_LYGHE